MQSKRFIICGVPRAGKSTLASKIAKRFGCSHIPLDPLMTAFHRQYPETGITLSMSCYTTEYKRIARITTEFLVHYIKTLDKELDSYVIEGFHMDIALLVEFFGDTHTIIVVGYPGVSVEKKLKAIRQFDTSNIHWTYVLEKTELIRQVAWFIELSKEFVGCAERLGIQFVDTSVGYGKVIEGVVEGLGGDVFDMWNEEKKVIDRNNSNNFIIHQREIWYVKLGKNIGYEQNGKKHFARPVLVIKKIGNIYFCLPLTSSSKISRWNHRIESIDFGKPSSVILSQARTLDSARFIRLIGTIDPQEHNFIKQKIAKLYGY